MKKADESREKKGAVGSCWLMFDLKWIRDHPEDFDRGLARRGISPKAEEILLLDSRRRVLISRCQTLQQDRNKASKLIGVYKRKGEPTEVLMGQVGDLKNTLQEEEIKVKELEHELNSVLTQLPNLPGDGVPDGDDEGSNAEIRRVGSPKTFEHPVKFHYEIGEALGQMDFERAAVMSGSRFVVLTSELARLERALASFMLDLHVERNGYTEVSPPSLVREAALFGTGQLPKFAEDLFVTKDERWLIPTAEVPLTNMVAGRTLHKDQLPIRLVAHTPCFRAEAGAAGKDTRGMVRVHEFSKVELVSVTTPEASNDELERMTSSAESILKELDLPYRVMLLATGDMGFSARKTYDLEVWIPGEERYREISSCSTCGDFQSRRLGARLSKSNERGATFVHTLNGSGLAVGRTLVAIMENYQNPDGSVNVPSALQSYMGGLERISVPDPTGQ